MSEKLYTTNQLAKLFGVVPTTVIDWIERGKLDAFKTLGGHRRITHAAVLDFLRENRLPFPPAFVESEQRVLVLSEDPALLKSLGEVLARDLPEARASLAQHPVDALLQIGAEHPHVVVFDLRMSGMDPFEFARRLRAGSAPRHLRLLALAADDSTEAQARALQSGADTSLAASRAAEELAARCRALLAPQRAGP